MIRRLLAHRRNRYRFAQISTDYGFDWRYVTPVGVYVTRTVFDDDKGWSYRIAFPDGTHRLTSPHVPVAMRTIHADVDARLAAEPGRRGLDWPPRGRKPTPASSVEATRLLGSDHEH